jgi:large subunit ribosomal protein L10
MMAKSRIEARQQKEKTIKQLEEVITSCNIAILTDYRSIASSEMMQLRRKLREVGVEFKVVKNTLARFAAEAANKPTLAKCWEGPIAIAYSYDSEIVPAKIIYDHIQATKSELKVKSGFIGERILTEREVTELAKLPPQDVLIGKVVAGMKSPLTGLVNVLGSPMRGLIYSLKTRIQQLEGVNK